MPPQRSSRASKPWQFRVDSLAQLRGTSGRVLGLSGHVGVAADDHPTLERRQRCEQRLTLGSGAPDNAIRVWTDALKLKPTLTLRLAVGSVATRQRQQLASRADFASDLSTDRGICTSSRRRVSLGRHVRCWTRASAFPRISSASSRSMRKGLRRLSPRTRRLPNSAQLRPDCPRPASNPGSTAHSLVAIVPHSLQTLLRVVRDVLWLSPVPKITSRHRHVSFSAPTFPT